MTKLLGSFYSRLSLTIIASFVLVGVLLLVLAQELTQTYQQEVEQKLHLQLAEHIAKDDGLIKDGQIDKGKLEHAFHSMMILGPSFEFYILDPSGKVTTYSADPDKIVRHQVDLRPIKALLAGKQMLPVLGDDPRSRQKQKIFSVAEIKQGEELKAYLYIIIGGEIYDNVVELIQKSHIVKLSFWGLIASLVFALLVVLALFAMQTRPLRRLTQDVQKLDEQGFEQAELIFSQWQAHPKDEVSRLGIAFNRMANTLKEQYQKVKNTDQLRRELISYVSHDLRTPLASLQGYLETWQLKHHELSDTDSQQLVATALKNAKQTSRLVEQLFELAHLDGDDVRLKLEPVAIAELVQDLFNNLPQGNISFDVQPKDASLMVMADIEKLERVLINLFDNARRHCLKGDQIQVLLEAQAGSIKICVKDSGSGIPAKDLSHIFEPHYRASNSAQGSGRHSGLGLAITQRIIALHGSAIDVESELGVGTSFSFTLKTPP